MHGSSYRDFESKKKHISGNTKLIPVAPDDILRSYEAKQSVCARNWTLFTTLLPVIQSLKWTDRSDVWFMNHSFEPVIFSESVNKIKQNYLKQFMARAAQIYKFLNQNSLSNSSNRHWTEQTVWLGPKADEPLICACVKRALERRSEIKVFIVSHCLCTFKFIYI